MQKRLFKTLLLSTVVIGGAIGIDPLGASPLITTQPLRLSPGQQANAPINDLNVPLNIRQEYKCPKELSFADIKEIIRSKKRFNGHDYVAFNNSHTQNIRKGNYDAMMRKARRNPWLLKEWFSVLNPLEGIIKKNCLYEYHTAASTAAARFAFMMGEKEKAGFRFLMGTSTQYKLNTIAIKNTTDKEIVVMVFKSDAKGQLRENTKQSFNLLPMRNIHIPFISDAKYFKIRIRYQAVSQQQSELQRGDIPPLWYQQPFRYQTVSQPLSESQQGLPSLWYQPPQQQSQSESQEGVPSLWTQPPQQQSKSKSQQGVPLLWTQPPQQQSKSQSRQGVPSLWTQPPQQQSKSKSQQGVSQGKRTSPQYKTVRLFWYLDCPAQKAGGKFNVHLIPRGTYYVCNVRKDTR
jgi:hypothetical protein